jgi:phosphoribosylformylglycinamidine synthase
MRTGRPAGNVFSQAGLSVILLGGLGNCDAVRFGGTQYAHTVLGRIWGLPPALDLDYEKRVQTAMRQIAEAGLVESAHDLSDGGLAVALAECAFGPAGVGALVDLDTEVRPEYVLFHEGPSRILLSAADADAVARIAANYSVPAPVIGITVAGRLSVGIRGKQMLNAGIGELRSRWESALESKLRG